MAQQQVLEQCHANHHKHLHELHCTRAAVRGTRQAGWLGKKYELSSKQEAEAALPQEAKRKRRLQLTQRSIYVARSHQL